MYEKQVPPFRFSDPETSVQAGLSVNKDELWARISAVLVERGPLNTEEIADILGVSRDSISPRMREMVREDMAHETKLRRKTSRGKSAIAWAAGKAPTKDEVKERITALWDQYKDAEALALAATYGIKVKIEP